MKRIHVAAAVIRGADGRVLIAKRPLDKHQGGLWEFPGGKVEAGERVEAALARELLEELGIVVTAAQPLIQVRHNYPDKQVLLDVWEVQAFTGEPHGAEGQPLMWVTADQLTNYSFPAANLITPDGLAPQRLLEGLARALDDGIRLIQLRVPSLPPTAYRALAERALPLCEGRAQLMLKGPLQWACDYPEAGWHLTADQLREHAGRERPIAANRWLAASCHDAEELALAAALGVDFVTLSPVLATASHPDASPLGWAQVVDLLLGFDRPAYLLGGLQASDLSPARQAGAQGVAAIRAFWPD